MEGAVAARSVECGMPTRSRSGVWSSAADRLTFAGFGGRRRPSYSADLPSRGCCSARRDDGSIGKSRVPVGISFPVLPESSPNHRARRNCLMMVRAEKDENNGTEETPEVVNVGQPITVTKSSALVTSPGFWLQVGIFVFSAGFVDAGFSGDWSRIGVVSRQTEEELQIAAVGVLPLAITLIWSISERRKTL